MRTDEKGKNVSVPLVTNPRYVEFCWKEGAKQINYGSAISFFLEQREFRRQINNAFNSFAKSGRMLLIGSKDDQTRRLKDMQFAQFEV